MSNLLQETNLALRSLGVHARKKWGQNFMIESQTLSFMAEQLDLQSGETVLEIGPGLGFLTRELLGRGAQVIAVEKDPLMIRYLGKCFGSTVRLLEKDILCVDLKKDLNIERPIKVIGNIPYNITSPILEWLIGQRLLVSEAELSMQWEVAQRLTAKPGTKAWGALTIFVQVYAEVQLKKKVGKNNFYPPPKIDSAVVKLLFSGGPKFTIPNEEDFFKCIRHAFQKRRKTLLNALTEKSSAAHSKTVIKSVLQQTGIDPTRRPETLSIPEWVKVVCARPIQMIL